MGVVHHGSFLLYLEEARVAYLRSVGHPYGELRATGLDVAVIEAGLRYLAPASFDDVLDVHLLVAAARGSTFEIGYLVSAGERAIVTAVTVHAAIDAATGRPHRLPSWLAALAVDGRGPGERSDVRPRPA
jgi:acyl-CoA thioester hydrolase